MNRSKVHKRAAKKRRTIVGVFSILMVILLVAAACGSDDDTPTAVPATSTSVPATATPIPATATSVSAATATSVPAATATATAEPVALLSPWDPNAFVPKEPEHDLTDGVSLMFPIPDAVPVTDPEQIGNVPDPGEQAIPGGWLRLNIFADPFTLDPSRTSSEATIWPILYVHDRLFRYRNGPGISGTDFTPVPSLGLDLLKIDDTTYWVPLREGVTWPNQFPVNGREFVCDDVEFSLWPIS